MTSICSTARCAADPIRRCLLHNAILTDAWRRVPTRTREVWEIGDSATVLETTILATLTEDTESEDTESPR